MFPYRTAVLLSTVSELQKWEAPDPAFWVNNGYAVINPDARGAMKSEGDICMWGSQEGKDGSDLVDWVGVQNWCNGKVALSGNSWLSVAQWFIAAERPKHLACIAPWEGFTDLYAELLARGGVMTRADADFSLAIIGMNAGENSWENGVAMAKLPFGEYHKDKAAKVENIDVPVYVVASWSNQVHTFGTFSGFARLASPKWLRIHDTWEWPDYYQNQEDLLRFFDFFMKGLQNGWDETPRVRAKIIDTASPVPLARDLVSTAFPLPESLPTQLFLSNSRELCPEAESTSGQLQFELKDGSQEFTYEFRKDTILCGPVRMRIAISLSGAKDADVFVYMEKLLVSGSVGKQFKLPIYDEGTKIIQNEETMPEVSPLIFKGPEGRCRVSKRQLNPERAAYGLEIADLSSTHYVDDNQVVILAPSLQPIGMSFSKGEKLRVHITGTNKTPMPGYPFETLATEDWPAYNTSGTLSIHFGKDSYITLPVVL